ncbi:ribonuclease H-like domain-containing protein [Panaeolus papilionaceus]|nr:ribonuclease H-like domain-containing protein [Panaeolus papilionaceus]
MWHVALPAYKPASRDKLEGEHIIGEAERILELQVEFLKTQKNITVSCDGGTSRGKESFWTVHMSVVQKVFLMEMREATAVSHTGEWIKSLVLERISAVTSDSTGNTRLHRELLAKEIPTILNMPDIVHFISNMIKNFIKLPYFKSCILVIRAVITKFHKSHLGTVELNRARKRLGIGRGLEAIGKTRFGTIIAAANSVRRNYTAIQQVVQARRFDLGDLAESFEDGLSLKKSQFIVNLTQLCELGTPALKALTCLEANEASPADVFIFWHSLLAATKDVVMKKNNQFPEDVQEEIFGIMSMRHEQLFGEDGDLSSGANVYLAAAYLHPHYIHSDIFLDIDNSVVGLDMQGIRHASLYRTVATILARIAGNEILHGAQPEFTRWRGHASVFKERLRNQLKTYARRQYPFNQPLNLEHDGIVEWWTRLDGQTDTDVLVVSIVLFSPRYQNPYRSR